MLNKEPAPRQSGKSRLSRVWRGLFAGKKIFTIITIILGLIAFTNAQGITNTLGGNTATDKFIVENSESDACLVVTGEGNVGIGTTNPTSKLSVGGIGFSTASIYGETAEDFGVFGYASNNGDVTNFGGYFSAAGSSGRGVFGYASNTGYVTNYGGYFEAKGWNGRGVHGEASGYKSYGVYGKASGDEGCGVYGSATSNAHITNFGGYFLAAGRYGRGVYGYTSGESGRGVCGNASGESGRGVCGEASGSNGVGVYGSASGSNGTGVRGYGGAYDFYAAGQGENYGSASSIRWKRNIIEIDNPLEKLEELRGVYFDWDEEHGGQHDVGCIAEEVGKVLPEIVVYEENGIDADGMDYSKLTPLLVEAVKELQQIVEAQQERIAVLERR